MRIYEEREADKLGNMRTQIGGTETADGPFAPHQSEKETVIIAQEQIETSVGMAVILGGLGHFVDGFESCIGIIDIRHEGEVAFIGGF